MSKRQLSPSRAHTMQSKSPHTYYSLNSQIGKGSFGVVWCATKKNSDVLFAIKCSRIGEEDNGISCTTLREVSFLREVQHPNIIDAREAWAGMTDVSMVMTYCQKDLHVAIKAGLPQKLVRSFMKQLLCGVAEMHSRCWMHRDLKPQNILILDDTVLKITDFGQVRNFQSKQRARTLNVTTIWYESPEIILGNDKYGSEIDLWSVGCVLGEMITGKPLFGGDSQVGTLFRIFRCVCVCVLVERPWRPPFFFFALSAASSLVPRLLPPLFLSLSAFPICRFFLFLLRAYLTRLCVCVCALCRVLGTPTATRWAKGTRLPNFNPLFPVFKGGMLPGMMTSLEKSGVELITRLLEYSAKMRITASSALQSSYITGDT